jgi:hypothetical protein
MSATDDLNLQQEWAKKFTLEQRVAALEHAVIAIQRHLGLPVTALEQLERATEGFKEFPPEFLEEVARYGREFRYADRPGGDPLQEKKAADSDADRPPRK